MGIDGKFSTIGTGSYSEVYRVRRITDNKEYALKKVRVIYPYRLGEYEQVD